MLEASLKKEVIRMCAGISVMSVLMLLVFALFGRFDTPVLYGAILGTGITVLNYFLLALSVSYIANATPEKAKLFMHISYFLRIILIAAAVACAIRLPFFNYIAAVLPLIFERLVIIIMHSRDGKNEHTGS